MEPKLVTRRSLSAVPIITVPPQYKEVTKGTERPRRSSRVMFLDENGNEIVDEENKDPYQGHVKGFSKEGRLLPSSATLHLRRRSTSLDAARFTAWYNSRRNSSLRRDQFLQSFGKASIRYPNLNDEDIMETTAHTATKIDVSAFEAEPLDGDVLDCRKRSQSAGPILHRPSSSGMKSDLSAHKNVLEIRGTEYTGDPPDLADLTAKIRQQSAKRRIKRIMEADKEKAEQERLSREEEERRKAEALKNRRRTLKSATFAVMAMNVSAAGFNFKSFTEKKKWLAEKRSWTKQIAKSKFSWAIRVVMVFGRVLKTLMSYSADMTPETAAQRSFRTLRDNSEVKEMLFNKSLPQRGKSQYAYVPSWAKKILDKPAMERSENELSQLHSMLKGLASYDKFTYRIQLAMCRAMTYTKVEHTRVILRKGHTGVSFYFIFSGSVFVNVEELLLKTGHVMWHTAITLQRGDSFGELALLRNIKRTASVVVREDAELLVVEKDVFSKTCPKIFDKELVDKIKFCKSLSLFRQWTDDALKNVCIEAQIQEWKANKIIVKDSSKEVEWINLCMQGKCSVIKALDLRAQLKLPRPRRATNEEYFPMGLIGRKRRTQSDTSKIWLRELEESLKTPYSFNDSNKVDEHRDENERNTRPESEYESSDDEKNGAEKILEAMDLPYKDQPHAKGDSSYILNEDDEDEEEEEEPKQTEAAEILPAELEKRDNNILEDFSELIKIESKAGKLNKDVVYLNISSMKSGDIFDVSQVLRPTGRKLMLVSKGAVMLRIKRDDFFRYSTKHTLRQARKAVQELDYPPEEIIYRSYNERCAWEKLKSTQLQSVMNTVQDKCIRHNVSFTESTSEVKRPLTPARVDSSCPSRLEKFDQYLSFVYGSHKVPEGGPTSTSSVTKTCSTLQNCATKEKNCMLSHQQDERKSVTFAFGTAEKSE